MDKLNFPPPPPPECTIIFLRREKEEPKTLQYWMNKAKEIEAQYSVLLDRTQPLTSLEVVRSCIESCERFLTDLATDMDLHWDYGKEAIVRIMVRALAELRDIENIAAHQKSLSEIEGFNLFGYEF